MGLSDWQETGSQRLTDYKSRDVRLREMIARMGESDTSTVARRRPLGSIATQGCACEFA